MKMLLKVVQGSRLISKMLVKVEDAYTFFKPEVPSDYMIHLKTKAFDASKHFERPPLKASANRSGSKASHGKISLRSTPNLEKTNHSNSALLRKQTSEKTSWNVLDLEKENYFPLCCWQNVLDLRKANVGKDLNGSSDDVVLFLTRLAEASQSV